MPTANFVACWPHKCEYVASRERGQKLPGYFGEQKTLRASVFANGCINFIVVRTFLIRH